MIKKLKVNDIIEFDGKQRKVLGKAGNVIFFSCLFDTSYGRAYANPENLEYLDPNCIQVFNQIKDSKWELAPKKRRNKK